MVINRESFYINGAEPIGGKALSFQNTFCDLGKFRDEDNCGIF